MSSRTYKLTLPQWTLIATRCVVLWWQLVKMSQWWPLTLRLALESESGWREVRNRSARAHLKSLLPRQTDATDNLATPTQSPQPPALFLVLSWSSVRQGRLPHFVPYSSVSPNLIKTCQMASSHHLRLTGRGALGPAHSRLLLLESLPSAGFLRPWFLLNTALTISLGLLDWALMPSGLCWTWLMAASLVTAVTHLPLSRNNFSGWRWGNPHIIHFTSSDPRQRQ